MLKKDLCFDHFIKFYICNLFKTHKCHQARSYTPVVVYVELKQEIPGFVSGQCGLHSKILISKTNKQKPDSQY